MFKKVAPLFPSQENFHFYALELEFGVFLAAREMPSNHLSLCLQAWSSALSLGMVLSILSRHGP